MLYSVGDMYNSSRLKAEAFKVIEDSGFIDYLSKPSGSLAVI